jgi:hypothetical protein
MSGAVARVATALLPLCSGGASAASPAATARSVADDAAILHVLQRVTYGPRPGDLSRVKAMGRQRLAGASARPAGAIDDRAWSGGWPRCPR